MKKLVISMFLIFALFVSTSCGPLGVTGSTIATVLADFVSALAAAERDAVTDPTLKAELNSVAVCAADVTSLFMVGAPAPTGSQILTVVQTCTLTVQLPASASPILIAEIAGVNVALGLVIGYLKTLETSKAPTPALQAEVAAQQIGSIKFSSADRRKIGRAHDKAVALMGKP